MTGGRRTALFADQPGSDPHVEVDTILDDLALWHALKVQPRPCARMVQRRRPPTLLVVVLCLVTQRLGPKAGDAHRLRAVEGNLELLDR